MKNMFVIVLFILIGLIFCPALVLADSTPSSGSVTIAGPGGSAADPAGSQTLGFDWGKPDILSSTNPTVNITPVQETLDLKQSGTLESPYIATMTEMFSYVTAILWTLTFQTGTLNITKFGVNNPLINGINVLYDSVSLLDNQNVTATEDFSNQDFQAWKFVILTDQALNREMIARWVYSGDGLEITATKLLQFYIQDNLASLTNVTEFSVTVEGYREEILNYIEPIDDDKYYYGEEQILYLENLEPETEYYISITDIQEILPRTNFTFYATKADVTLKFAYAPYLKPYANDTINDIRVDLYEQGSEVILDTIYFTFITSESQVNTFFKNIDKAIMFIFGGIIIFSLIVFVKWFK